MALMDVAYGKPYDVHSFDSKYYDFNYERLQKTCPGANCLHSNTVRGGRGSLDRHQWDLIQIPDKEQS